MSVTPGPWAGAQTLQRLVGALSPLPGPSLACRPGPRATVPASPRLAPAGSAFLACAHAPFALQVAACGLKLIGRLAAAFLASALRWAVPDSVTALLPPPLPTPAHTRPVSGCREPSTVLPWSLIHVKAG